MSTSVLRNAKVASFNYHDRTVPAVPVVGNVPEKQRPLDTKHRSKSGLEGNPQYCKALRTFRNLRFTNSVRSEAALELGWLLMDSGLNKQSVEEALKWFHYARKLENQRALYCIGRLYHLGKDLDFLDFLDFVLFIRLVADVMIGWLVVK